MADHGDEPKTDGDSSIPAPTAASQTSEAPIVTGDATEAAPMDGTTDPASRPKAEKAEPINIVVRDQSGAGLQFKVRKNTKFEKVMSAFCQKKHYQMAQVRFLFEGERIREDQTPQSVEMEEGDIIDCVIEQLGGWSAVVVN